MISLFVVGFGRPDLLREQHRLLTKYPDKSIAEVCYELDLFYFRVNGIKNEHHEALALASSLATEMDYWGCIDHDIFPYRETSLISRIEQAGFLGMGQSYTPRIGKASQYLWPGWIFFSNKWLDGRTPNFDGIRAEFKFDDGDCGSMLHSLFTEEDWQNCPNVEHSYGTIREEDGHGLQSFGFERIDDWIHLTNASHWKDVPDSEGRDRLLLEMIRAL